MRARRCVAGPVTALALVAALAAGCTPTAAPPGAAPAPRPVEAAGDRRRPVVQPERFRARLVNVRAQPLGNRRLFADKAAPRYPTAARKAARGATARYRRYLDTTFVAPKTRGTRAGLRPFATRPLRRSLRPADLRALGMKGLRLQGGRRSRARVRATVVQQARRPVSVLLRVRATMRAATPAGKGRLEQSGAVVLVHTGRGWRADMLDLRLRLPGGRDSQGRQRSDKQPERQRGDKQPRRQRGGKERS